MQLLRDVLKAGNVPGLLHVSLKLGLGLGGGAVVNRCDESWKCPWTAACIIEVWVGVRWQFSSDKM